MCQTTNRRQLKTPSPVCMLTVVVVLAIFLSIESVAGSCLNYGHACWGAHGKRNGGQVTLPRIDNEVPSNRDEAKAEWFLSKIINPLDLRNNREGNEVDASMSQPEIADLFTDLEAKSDKRPSGWDKIRDIYNNPVLSDSGRNIENFFKSSKFVEKRSTEDK